MKLTLYLLFLFVCLVGFTKAQSPTVTESPIGIRFKQMKMRMMQMKPKDELNKKNQDSTTTDEKGPIDCENPVWPYTFKCNGLKMRDDMIAMKMSQIPSAIPSKGVAGPAN